METNEENEGIEFTRSHTDREMHHISRASQRKAAAEDENDNNGKVSAADREGGEKYSNTNTGYHVSAADRKESFTDPDYGATAGKTANEIKDPTAES